VTMATPEEVWMMQARAMKEDELQAQTQDLLTALGWRWFHMPAIPNRKITPGFPDLAFVKPPRHGFAELKQQARYPEPAQREWLEDYLACGVETFVWRPYDLISRRIEAVLRGVPFQEPLPTKGRDVGLTRL
jgi:hypothetical protein